MDTHPKENLHDRKKAKGSSNDKENKRLIVDDTDKKDKVQISNIKERILSKLLSPTNLIIIANISLCVGCILYILTLKGCDLESQAECLKSFDQSLIKLYVMVLISSAFCFSSIYNLTIYKKIHYVISIYTTVLIWFLCFVYDTGADLKTHGSFNRVFLFALMLICFLIQNFLILIYILIKRIGMIRGTIGLILILIICGASIHFKLRSSCSDWRKGLGDSEMDNTLPGCKIREPYYCWMNFMDNVFDISGWMGENCEEIRMDNYEQVIRWVRKPNAKVLGYPRVENWKFFPDSILDQYQFRLLGNIIDMEDPTVDQRIKDRTEVILDFKKNKPEMTSRVTRDEKLIEQRKKVRSSFKNTKFITKNVIHLFIDSLSRDNFKRKLPKSRAFLDKLYNNKNSEARSYQFFKYHAIASWTSINMVPATFGVEGSHIGSPVHNTKYFKDKGFITSKVSNYCSREFYDIEPGNLSKFLFESFDHENNYIGCDPNYCVPGHPFAILNGPYGMKRRCLYGKDTSHYVFEYSKKFWKAYPDQPKYLRTNFIDAHEGTGEVVKYMDDKLLDFLKFLQAEGSLKDTTIFFQADHGVNMPGFYTFVDAQDFWIEKTLPAVFLVVPQEVAIEYDEILKDKENLLLSPYDIHNTLLHLANAPKMAYNEIGKSFFTKTTDREERNCEKFKVIDSYCQCVGERE